MSARLLSFRRLRLLLPVALAVLAACGSRVPTVLAPLPDRPWLVLPGDEVTVRVYREPDLTGQYIVTAKGDVFIPGVGRIPAAGMTADSISAVITSAYTRRIRDAIVDVGLVRNLPVLGQVVSPGVYRAEPTMSVQQIVAKAGGVRGMSLKVPTYLLQKGRDGTRYTLAADLRLDRLAIDAGDALVVVSPSWVERTAPGIATLNQFAGALSIFVTVLLISKK